MREVNLASLDLNLLVALAALLEERSVTRAADRVGLSQPAMSRALARLRLMFADRLLVRTAAGLVPTPRAAALETPLRRLLGDIGRLVRPPVFDPVVFTGTWRLAIVDYIGTALLPGVLRRLEREAPLAVLDIVPGAMDTAERLARGEVDLAVGVFPGVEAGFYRRAAFDDSLVCVVRDGHPCLREPLTVERFAALRHAFLTVRGDARGGQVDEALAAAGLARQIVLRIPHFLSAALIVAETDLILTLPERLADQLGRLVPITLVPVPFALPSFQVVLLWHERQHEDPAHAWVRGVVAAVAAEIAAGGLPAGA